MTVANGQKSADSGSQVIIVDDDQLVRDFAMHTMKYGANREIVVFDNGFQAWHYILSRPDNADIIIADANIPEMDGLELLAQSKQKRPEKKFIITTSNPSHEEQACLLGADAFLFKPFDVADLFTILQQLIIENGNPTENKVTSFPKNTPAD